MHQRTSRLVAITACAAASAALAAGCAAGKSTALPASTQPTASAQAPSHSTPVPSRDVPEPAGDPAQAADDASQPAGNQSGHAVLGPVGYRAPGHPTLRLGMSQAEAEATGLLVDPHSQDGCTWYHIREDAGGTGAVGHQRVAVSESLGVVNIPGPNETRTPEGVTSGQITPGGPYGSTLEEVRQHYPQFTVKQSGVYLAPTPGNASSSYLFVIRNDRVEEMTLASNDTGECQLTV